MRGAKKGFFDTSFFDRDTAGIPELKTEIRKSLEKIYGTMDFPLLILNLAS